MCETPQSSTFPSSSLPLCLPHTHRTPYPTPLKAHLHTRGLCCLPCLHLLLCHLDRKWHRLNPVLALPTLVDALDTLPSSTKFDLVVVLCPLQRQLYDVGLKLFVPRRPGQDDGVDLCPRDVMFIYELQEGIARSG